MTRQVLTLGALLQGGADNTVVELIRVDACALHSSLHCIRRERRRFQIIKGTPVGFTDRGTGGGDDNGVFHGFPFL